MSIPRHFEYKGQKYDIGTKVKLKTRWSGIVETTFRGYNQYDCLLERAGATPDDYIVEIIEPVYYVEPEPTPHKKVNIFFRTGSGSAAHNDDVFYGFLLYLFVMIGGVIFKDRWLIWIMATIIYFGWKKKL